jgi:hypothetical protein
MNEEPITSVNGVIYTYWNIERDVSNNFNRLKGKLFNLIEATVTDKQQCEAMKGLIKDFANSEFALCVENLRYTAKGLGLVGEETGSPIPSLGAQPLEGEWKKFS